MNIKRFLTLILACGFMGIASTGHAALAPIGTTLTGDIRYSDLSDLLVDVDISFDIGDGSLSNWTVDLAPLTGTDDSGAKLLGFWFNLDVLSVDNLLFSNVTSGWSVGSAGNNIPGAGIGNGNSGSVMFQYEADSTNNGNAGLGKDTPLEFTLQLLGPRVDASIPPSPVDWTADVFSNALVSTGAAGTGQLGAHVGGLRNDCSGFVMGNYDGSGNGGTAPNDLKTCGSSDVPEPASLALIGLGLLGLYGVSRRKA